PAGGPAQVDYDVPRRGARGREGGAALRVDRRSLRRGRGAAPGARQRGGAAGPAPAARAGPRRAHRPGTRAVGAPQQGGYLLWPSGDGPRGGHAHEHSAVEHGARVLQRPAGGAERGRAAGRGEGVAGGGRRGVPAGALRAEVALATSRSVGIHVPSSAVGVLGSGEAYAEFYRQVEALGLDAVWTEDRIFHAANMLDPLMLLAGAAASTRRIQLGTAVLVLPLPNAAVLPPPPAPLP